MRIFNRIRQKLLADLKIRSYFFYALGEIFLIVIGVFIALQINNWNEHKKEIRNERIVLSNLEEYFETNLTQIESSLLGLETIRANAVLRIRCTGPQVTLPSADTLAQLSLIDNEKLVLAYDGTNKLLSQNQLSLISSEEIRKSLIDFGATLVRYKTNEELVYDLVLSLRKTHQKYVSVLEQEFSRSKDISSDKILFPSDYLGWLRDRDHQNRAVECKWKIEDSIIALKELESINIELLELLK